MTKRRGTIFLTLITTLVSIAQSNDVEIQVLDTPLLPLELGKTKLIETKHTFLHFIEIDLLVEQLKNVENLHTILESYLNSSSLKDIDLIQSLFEHTKYLLNATRIKLSNLVYKDVKEINNRSKRELFNGIGTISKWLFGTLDHDDEIKYNSEIKQLIQNQNSISHELKLQSSLNTRLIDHYNKIITSLYKNQLLLQSQVNEIYNKSQDVARQVFVYFRLPNALNQIILNCQNLINFIDNLENSIIFAHLGSLHTSIISLNHLSELINRVSIIYGESKIVKFKNPYNYYQLAGVQVKVQDSRIIIAIHIPILIDSDFLTYHIIPLPYKNSIIVPRNPLLVLGTNSHQYEEKLCPSIESIFFCRQHEEAINDTCVIPLIRAETPTCRFEAAALKHPVVEQINSKFLLLLPTENPMKAEINCDKNRIAIIKSNTLIKLLQGCSVKIGKSLYENTEEKTNGNPLLLPKLRLTPEFEVTTNRHPPLQLESVDLKSIKDIRKEADSYEILEKQKVHPAIWNMPSLTLLFVGLIIIYIWYRRRGQEDVSQPLQEDQKPENNPPSVLFSPKEGGVI